MLHGGLLQTDTLTHYDDIRKHYDDSMTAVDWWSGSVMDWWHTDEGIGGQVCVGGSCFCLFIFLLSWSLVCKKRRGTKGKSVSVALLEKNYKSVIINAPLYCFKLVWLFCGTGGLWSWLIVFMRTTVRLSNFLSSANAPISKIKIINIINVLMYSRQFCKNTGPETLCVLVIFKYNQQSI